jgi:hypothetical protein
MAFGRGVIAAMTAVVVAACSSGPDRVACSPCRPDGIYIDASAAIAPGDLADSAQICVDGACRYTKLGSYRKGHVDLLVPIGPERHAGSLVITLFDGIHPLTTLRAQDLTLPPHRNPGGANPCACGSGSLSLRYDPTIAALVPA